MEMKTDLPNVVFITGHDLGKHLPIYYAKSVEAPNIEEISKDGIIFDRAFSTAPQCSPARAAIATGRYPHSNGVMGLAHKGFDWILPPSERHIAKYLKDLGFYTALIGLQHITRRSNIPSLGFEYFDSPDDTSVDSVLPRVLSWIDNLKKDKIIHQKPFYLEVGFWEVHRPWDKYKMEYTKGISRPYWLPPYQDEGREIGQLQGSIHKLDKAVGQIFESLSHSDLIENTIFIFTTDHGLDLPRAKGTLYDPGIETSLVIHYPKTNQKCKRFSNLISTMDIFPTILDEMDAKIPDEVQGISFKNLLHGKPYKEREFIFAEKTFHSTYDPIRAIRNRKFKLIAHFETYDNVDVTIDSHKSYAYDLLRDELTVPNNYVELYDLETDPLELHDLSRDGNYETIMRDLLEQLYQFLTSTGDPLLNGPVLSPHHKNMIKILKGEFKQLPDKNTYGGLKD